MIDRPIDKAAFTKLMALFPVTAILGPRQSGKSTLARAFPTDHFFDLENPRDLALLAQPQLVLEPLSGLIVIDEIQRAPALFPLLRHLVDTRPDQRYLILGSASRDLIRQSSESLAGRIGLHELGGLRLSDIGTQNWRPLWHRGASPPSFTARTEDESMLWREQYVATFLERDIPQLGITIPAVTLRRFWTMLCHYHGQVLNHSELARAFGISDMTVRRYLDILEGTFMVRLLQPRHINTRKRLVKRPKLYLRDTGLLHTLLAIRSERNLATHHKLGASWEGFALEVAARACGKRSEEFTFWSTHSGAEVDLFWLEHGKNWAVEIKYADAPRLSPSMTIAFHDLELSHLWVLYPGDRSYPLAPKITTLPITAIGEVWPYPDIDSLRSLETH
ncbi:MAG: ATP-binding protein [Pseudomonadota bacterium]|nr:ATP-binding protein [Pseudomonadota bacterium]